ncbi:MAG TPA: dipeptide epimerase [Chitinophagaceae bacterium]|nr:dipeptide epimerase [Chitinophagaceae bacterium]
MKILSIDFELVDLELTRPYQIAYKTITKVENVIAAVTLENGIKGMGAANPSRQVVGDDAGDTIRVLQNWDQERLLKKDIRAFHDCLGQVHSTLREHAGARAALDIALHDAFTRWLNIPLAQFLGQKIPALPTSITIGIKNTEETFREAEEYIGRGFRFLKIKLGKSLDEDVERLIMLREKFGKSIHIRIDANQAYSPNEVLRFYKETKGLNLELIEQPLSVNDTGKLKQLPLNIRKLIAADESLVSPEDAFQLASHPQSCGIFNIKLMKCGGIQPAGEIAALAGITGIDLMWGCNDESMISIAAALHSALSWAHTRYLDLDGSLDLANDVVADAFTLKEGILSVTGRPGLGWRDKETGAFRTAGT